MLAGDRPQRLRQGRYDGGGSGHSGGALPGGVCQYRGQGQVAASRLGCEELDRDAGERLFPVADRPPTQVAGGGRLHGRRRPGRRRAVTGAGEQVGHGHPGDRSDHHECGSAPHAFRVSQSQPDLAHLRHDWEGDRLGQSPGEHDGVTPVSFHGRAQHGVDVGDGVGPAGSLEHVHDLCAGLLADGFHIVARSDRAAYSHFHWGVAWQASLLGHHLPGAHESHW